MSDVFSKVKKLLALARGRGTTEAEAALAAEHVQRLLQEHGLTLAQLEADSGDDGRAAVREKNQNHRAMYAYQQNLMRAIAEGNLCLYVVRDVFCRDDRYGKFSGYDEARREWGLGIRSKRHVVVGRELNVSVTLDTYKYLIAELARINPYDPRSRDGKRFLEGASVKIAERLAERRRQRERESAAARGEAPRPNGSGRELVLADVYGSESDLNNDALNGFPRGTTAARRRAAWELRERQDAERDRLVAAGMDRTEARYRSWGYDDETVARIMTAAAAAPSSRRAGRGRTRSWTSGDYREYEKVNSAAYRSGVKAGQHVGLDTQVGSGKQNWIEGR